jgi:hypothetical protein
MTGEPFDGLCPRNRFGDQGRARKASPGRRCARPENLRGKDPVVDARIVLRPAGA